VEKLSLTSPNREGLASAVSSGGVGSDPSEAFTIDGTGGGTTPEPGSFLLLASGVIALAGALRRRLS
jgi:hypothetical protein